MFSRSAAGCLAASGSTGNPNGFAAVHAYVHTALAERLADLEAQKDLAFATDFPAGV
jgi:hypothetical protein